jgi:hypothetical protein
MNAMRLRRRQDGLDMESPLSNAPSTSLAARHDPAMGTKIRELLPLLP